MVVDDNAWKLLREGQDLFFQDNPDYRGAVDVFERIKVSHPDWAEVQHWLGSAYEALGDAEKAAAGWQEAHRLDVTDSRCLISLGVLRCQQRRFEEAISLLERGVELKPHYGLADARLFLAEAYEGAGQIEKAILQWREVSTLEPMYPSYDEPMKEARRKLREHSESE